MNLKKFIFLILSIFALPFFVFSEDSLSEITECDESSELEVDPIWEETKETAKSVGNFFKRNAEKLNKKIQSNSKNACEGKWIFTNGKAETTILCNSDGTMDVRMEKENDIKLWRGSFESTRNEINFHIIVYNERINKKEKFDSLHSEDWKISYKVEDTEKMYLTSDSMSEDFNGYKFVNSTVFSRVK